MRGNHSKLDITEITEKLDQGEKYIKKGDEHNKTLCSVQRKKKEGTIDITL